MRRVAYLISAGITLVALSFAGFAVFAPVAVDAPETPLQIDLPDGRGLASGRLASMSFTAVASSVEIQSGSGSLMSASPVPGDRVKVLEAATTTIPTSSTSSSTTTPHSSTTSTTTTAPPVTTTTLPETTTTVAESTTTSVAPTTTTTTLPDTTTTTTTTTLPPTGPLTEAEMRELAARFFPADEVENAVSVARCESGFNPSAYNPAGPYGGLFQHLESRWAYRAEQAGYPGASIFDAEANTAAAAWLWEARGGWSPWGCAP